MTQPVRDPLTDLELHRLRLEENIEKLRQSLRHWQIWEAEYESLKEEIQALPSNANPQDLNRIADEFGGELVTEKEIKQLLAYQKNGSPTKSPKQVAEQLSRRVEYVQRNIETIQSQILSAERKIEGVSVISRPEARNEDGLPITEIYEELDDDGNVIASTTSHPDKAEPQVLEALKAVGLKKQDLSASTDVNRKPHPTSDYLAQTNQDRSQSTPSIGREKKSVSFAADGPDASSAKVDPNTARKVERPSNGSISTNVSDAPRTFINSNDRILELDEDDKIVGVVPNDCIDESPEDASMRRQMQAYSMAEVGNIVAQMDLDDMRESDVESLDSMSDSDDDLDEEDTHGISVDEHMSPEYIHEMLDLEKQLNAKMIHNIGPRSDLLTEESTALDPRRLVVQREEQQHQHPNALDDPKARKSKEPKSVRFADKLDVSETSRSKDSLAATASNQQPKPAPVAGSVIERSAPSQAKENVAKNPSRFKQARQAAEKSSNGASSGVQPQSQQNSDGNNRVHKNITERQPGRSRAALDEFDPDLVQQQVKSEYYRQRNRLIQKQGGFKPDQVAETDELAEDDEGSDPKPNKKVSLFKAARVQNGGTW